jgi:hypothetical protein
MELKPEAYADGIARRMLLIRPEWNGIETFMLAATIAILFLAGF